MCERERDEERVCVRERDYTCIVERERERKREGDCTCTVLWCIERERETVHVQYCGAYSIQTILRAHLSLFSTGTCTINSTVRVG